MMLQLETSLSLYKKMFLMRAAEDAIIKHYPENDMKTPMHMSYGQEATAAGVCQALTDRDIVFSSYRSHAIYIGKTDETDIFFAELYGKSTGSARGKSGSMHLANPEKGHYGSSAIVASQIPLALGAAFAKKSKKTNDIACVFFGDGALDEGAFWESINTAAVMKLPVLFVCEDNDFAVHTPVTTRQGYKNIIDVVGRFDILVSAEESGQAEAIYSKATSLVKEIRSSAKPAFLYLKTYRYLEHVGTSEDFDAGYRPRAVYEEKRAKDVIKVQRAFLLERGMRIADLEKIEKQILQDVEKSLAKAKAAPLPAPEDIFNGVW